MRDPMSAASCTRTRRLASASRKSARRFAVVHNQGGAFADGMAEYERIGLIRTRELWRPAGATSLAWDAPVMMRGHGITTASADLPQCDGRRMLPEEGAGLAVAHARRGRRRSRPDTRLYARGGRSRARPARARRSSSGPGSTTPPLPKRAAARRMIVTPAPRLLRSIGGRAGAPYELTRISSRRRGSFRQAAPASQAPPESRNSATARGRRVPRAAGSPRH